ncbi:hypothetical protein HMPREF0765_4618 [Sphingobacterium spiritivorum ATCC 33300]|uniref:PIN like domain-containing protein n=1 Tax=Sphingobacterium spiritivorum ATCC 33300 TaxID=525372 RepID=C2G4W2_SPHSI|nr:PIN domain-containing protein [Sphingobacterium spiritivorum]EEI89713.1 hypothetical protein HMPREF0765_4618 [Sphingobacterium spiritivorum ATCC 33300]QQS94756.1 DUF4935 domain-containing protein [Sphingobacterium spiritivorum]
MKEMFKWYFPSTKKEIEDIWKKGILTVDTNVLLDLYRYHLNTRQALLSSLKKFKGRAWLSHQVADEFFKNRNSVILSAAGAFNEAERLLLEVKKSVEEPLKKLKNSRIIPDELEENLETAINASISGAEESLKKIRSEYPNYKENDPILKSICNLFESSVGLPFEKEILNEVLKEAKRRKENKIPPGFKDSNKDGDRPFGDYIIWRQIIEHVKESKQPLIFVTSEQKEDWWEKSSGQITGPLYELLKEFYMETGQRFLFYRTDRFLEFSNESSSSQANIDAVEEIREFVSQRQRTREIPLIKEIYQEPSINTIDSAVGKLSVELQESTFKFTCSGHFYPNLCRVPSLKVKLVSCPPGSPSHGLKIGAGTTFDFHIHIKSTEIGSLLQPGEYIFEYEAKTN